MNHFQFQSPFFCKILGPTYSGKRKIIKNFLNQPSELIFPNIKRIIYCHIGPKPFYIENVEFFRGIPNFDHIKNSLIIFDDLEDFCVNNLDIGNLFSYNSFSNSVIFLSHKYSYQGFYEKLINSKIDYIFQTKNHIEAEELNKLGYNFLEKVSNFPLNEDYD
jgi:hypothetical protein